MNMSEEKADLIAMIEEMYALGGVITSISFHPKEEAIHRALYLHADLLGNKCIATGGERSSANAWRKLAKEARDDFAKKIGLVTIDSKSLPTPPPSNIINLFDRKEK